MDKVREEFEKWAMKRFPNEFDSTDPRAFAFLKDCFETWKAAHALYAKETEPLKWRWRGSRIFVGKMMIVEVYQPCLRPGMPWAVRDFKGDGDVFDTEEIAVGECEIRANVFLAKLRGEA